MFAHMWLFARFVVLLIFAGALSGVNAADEVIVRTTLGELKGTTEVSRRGRTFYSFKGIPFAQPPVGELRFKRPQPVQPWSSVLDATSYRPFCMQYEFDDKVHGNEDCLYLNVHTPKLPSGDDNPNLPVIVWFYGGSFTIGSGQFYGPSKLMDKDVVSVTLNYRLGPFGYLSTGDEALPGNMGMWDQVAALQWVHNNIRAFGGDPATVTLNGNSAGAASSFYHMLSTATSGLFSGVIAHSGTPLCYWAFQENPRTHAINLGKHLKCPVTNSQELVDCLKNLSADDIILASHKMVDGIFYPIIYAPVIEKGVEQPFITDTPLVLLETNQIANRVPVISGVTGDEGIMFYNRVLFHNKKFDQEFFDKKFSEFLRNITDLEGNLETVGNVVKSLYIGNKNVENSKEVVNIISEISGDAFFYAGNDQMIKYLANYNIPVYMFVFNYRSNFSIMDLIGGPRGGAAHVDDTFYIYDFGLLPYTMTKEDEVISDHLITMWVNFAKTKRPVQSLSPSTPVDWPRFTDSKPLYLLIDKQSTVEEGFRQERAELWNYVLPQIAATQEFTKEEL